MAASVNRGVALHKTSAAITKSLARFEGTTVRELAVSMSLLTLVAGSCWVFSAWNGPDRVHISEHTRQMIARERHQQMLNECIAKGWVPKAGQGEWIGCEAPRDIPTLKASN